MSDAALLISRARAARLLGCCQRTVTRLVQAGHLPAEKAGRTTPLKFRRSDLERLRKIRLGE